MVLKSMWNRPWEAAMHLHVMLAVVAQYMLLVKRTPTRAGVLFGLHCMWIVTKVIGSKREGIRMS
jgi:hypothetical protein